MALCEVLARAGVMSTQKLLAMSHRRRFAAVKQAHPAPWDASLLQVLGLAGLAFETARYAGLQAACALRVTTHALACSHMEKMYVRSAASFGYLYVCGGFNGREHLDNGEYLNPSGTWAGLPQTVSLRWGSSAATDRGRLYVCGGYAGRQYLRSASFYELAAGVWEELPPMGQRRLGAAATVVGGQLFVCGGRNAQVFLDSVECFDGSDWGALPSMGQKRLGSAMGSISGLGDCVCSDCGWNVSSSYQAVQVDCTSAVAIVGRRCFSILWRASTLSVAVGIRWRQCFSGGWVP